MFKSLLDRALRHIFTDNRYDTLSKTQIEAYTDLLAVAMVIDHHIAQQERDLIGELLEQFEWPSTRPSEHFINQSVRRAWGLLEAKEREAATLSYCKDIATRLGDDWLRQSAFTSAIKIIHADDEIADAETRLIDHIAEAFDFADDQRKALMERALAPPEEPNTV